MKFEFHDTKIGSLFGFTDDIKKNQNLFSKKSGNINILWNRNNETIDIEIDGLMIPLEPNQLVTTTYLQHVTYKTTQLPLTVLKTFPLLRFRKNKNESSIRYMKFLKMNFRPRMEFKLICCKCW